MDTHSENEVKVAMLRIRWNRNRSHLDYITRNEMKYTARTRDATVTITVGTVIGPITVTVGTVTGPNTVTVGTVTGSNSLSTDNHR